MILPACLHSIEGSHFNWLRLCLMMSSMQRLRQPSLTPLRQLPQCCSARLVPTAAASFLPGLRAMVWSPLGSMGIRRLPNLLTAHSDWITPRCAGLVGCVPSPWLTWYAVSQTFPISLMFWPSKLHVHLPEIVFCIVFFRRLHDHTLPEFLRLLSYNHLLFKPTLTLLPPGGLGDAGGSENILELKEFVLALRFEFRLAPKLTLNGLCDPWENDRRPP